MEAAIKSERIGGAVQLIREDLKFSEERLAELAGVDCNDVRKIESGEFDLIEYAEALSLVCAALGTTEDGLIAYSDREILPIDPAEAEDDVRNTIAALSGRVDSARVVEPNRHPSSGIPARPRSSAAEKHR